MASHILEIILISAQGLKLPSTSKRIQTYALAWVNSSTKLRTRVDRVGGENPTWNDKFLFKVTPEFLSSETSAVSVEIYSTGYLRDHIVGSVRVLVSNIVLSNSIKTPSFTALQIRRPSGRVHGVLNIGAMLMEGSAFAGFNDCDAIGYRDLMGESEKGKRQWLRKSKSMAVDLNAVCNGTESSEYSSCAESPCSDGGDSTTSSSSTASTVLKEWNGSGIPGLAPKQHRMRSISAGMLCGLLINRKYCSSPSDQNLDG
ncbi:uncharacterized protein LOC123216749 [Mangifera indica]|uniref:uncharacterized protein LOC123216749 n=1 Tax=Mangifera indica TaxID=29780 RepID=UPI001CFBBE98|nr:uncharacterized protein LOC123216749 [Mangifera indica]